MQANYTILVAKNEEGFPTQVAASRQLRKAPWLANLQSSNGKEQHQ